MRPWIHLILATLILAGCAAPEAVEGATPLDAAGSTGLLAEDAAAREVVLLSDTLTWHSSSRGTLWQAYQAEQPVLNPCLWESAPEGVHQTNLELGEARLAEGVTQLDVDFHWEDVDYLGTDLYIAYVGPSMEAPLQSAAIPRGEATRFDIPAGEAGRWKFWACVQEGSQNTADDPQTGPRYFAGDLTFELRMPAG
jgi:hypothetical protein